MNTSTAVDGTKPWPRRVLALLSATTVVAALVTSTPPAAAATQAVPGGLGIDTVTAANTTTKASGSEDSSATGSATHETSTPANTTSQAARLTCWVEAREPYYRNGKVYAQAVAHCSRRTNMMDIETRLLRNGIESGYGSDRCRQATACHETSSAVNRRGNERWCNVATMGKPQYHTATSCEDRGF